MICPKCNNPISLNARFCGTCGSVVDSAAPVEHIAPPPAPPAAAMAVGTTAGGGSTAAAWLAAHPAVSGVLQRIKNILLSPNAEWPLIAAEPTSVVQISVGYVLPLTALVALMSWVRLFFAEARSPFGGTVQWLHTLGLGTVAMIFLLSFSGLWIMALIIDGFAPTFGGSRDRRQAFKVAVYSFTPAYVGSVLMLLPILPTALQLFAGLYGIYLLYIGLPVVMRSPPDRALGYTATVIACAFLLSVVLRFLLLSLVFGALLA